MAMVDRQSRKVLLDVSADGSELSARAVDLFISSARDSIQTKGVFNVALSGGSTPLAMYQRLADPSYATQVDWNCVKVFWGDERYVPRGDPDNLYYAAWESLLSKVPIPESNIYPWPTVSVSPEGAARLYSEMLQDTFKVAWPRFDLILLGIGPDGHTASLFPYSGEAKQPSRVLTVPVYDAPKPPSTRLSFTLRLINDATNIVFLVSGFEKAEAVNVVLNGPIDSEKWPAQGVRPVMGHLRWLVDASAARELEPERRQRAWYDFRLLRSRA
jgi:6-phosphogluconolactonase